MLPINNIENLTFSPLNEKHFPLSFPFIFISLFIPSCLLTENRRKSKYYGAEFE